MSKQHMMFTLVAVLTMGMFTGNIHAQEGSDTTATTTDMAADTTTDMATTTPTTGKEDMPNEQVARAVFTSNIQNHEPTDNITSLNNNRNKIYFFSELTGLSGQTVTHRWQYQGKTMAEIKFNVGGPRWRVWSSKTLLPQWTGEWHVSIIDGSGNEVGEGTFTYTATSESQN